MRWYIYDMRYWSDLLTKAKTLQIVPDVSASEQMYKSGPKWLSSDLGGWSWACRPAQIRTEKIFDQTNRAWTSTQDTGFSLTCWFFSYNFPLT